MNGIDIFFLIVMALCVVMGFFKGIIKQVLTILGVIAVASLTAVVAPYVQGWLEGAIGDENLRNALAMIVAALLIAVVYGVVAMLVARLLRNIHVVGVLDRLLGAVMGFVVVYLVFAVLFALVKDTGEGFLPLTKKLLGDGFANSWVGNHIYKHNFFGDWIVVDIAQKLLDSLSPNLGGAARAFA